jgi:hypothetical protein
MNYSEEDNHGRRALQRAGRLFALLAGAAAVVAGGNLMAADIEATLYPGQTTTNSASVTVPVLPPNANVLFSFDCTSSMGAIIDGGKSNALSLVASLGATGVSFRYGVASFRDYPTNYTSCGYPSTYGDAPSGDYAYQLNQRMTATTIAVSAAINTLSASGGYDASEAYTRALYESYADTNVMWQAGAKRVVVNFGDDMPHACNLNLGIPGTGTSIWSTGGDPGRDGIMGTSDDLVLQEVLAGMASNHVVLLAARSSTYNNYTNYWANWTARTGGKAFLTTSDSLIKDLVDEITNSMTIACVSDVHVVAEPAAFNSWLTTVPASYDQICSGDARNFDLALTVPAGTPAGDYPFTLRVVDSTGVGYLSKSVLIHVLPTVPLPLALNNSNLTWTTATNLPWFGQTNVFHDGVASARSFFIRDNTNAGLHTTVTGPGTLSFFWKVSSQTNADVLSFASAGSGFTNHSEISGEVDWQPQVFYLGAGTQTLDWIYTKDLAGSAGLDAGFVDVVTYTNGVTKPFIAGQPQSQTQPANIPISFTVEAKGTPALAYQWRHDGNPIPGATNAALAIGNSSAVDQGVYSVRVTSPFGSIDSSNASLVILLLVASGDNSFGQLNFPPAAARPVAIAAGAWHNLALCSDGQVIAWGNNYGGECNVSASLRDAVAIAAGGYHNLALRLDGHVMAWGANDEGQTNVPSGLANVIAVAAGTWHSLALRADGTVVGWGDNAFGQTTPPLGLSNAVAIAAGGNHSLALRSDGAVVAWGENTGADGNDAGQSRVPLGLTNVVAIAAGEYHSLAVKGDGTLALWGDNSQGQCTVPAGLAGIVAVAGGGSHTLALKGDSTVAAWGNDWNNQCGIPLGLSNVVALAAGNWHSLMLEGTRPPAPLPLHPARRGTQFSLVAQTTAGRHYALEYKTTLAATNWTSLPPIYGNGTLQFLVDRSAAVPQRFYRVRQW